MRTALLALALAASPWGPPPRWQALGDSTTNCCSTAGWPAEFQRACHGVTMTNLAVAGSTTAQIRDNQWPVARDAGADVLVVLGGFNDIHNTEASPADIFVPLREVADAARDAGRRVVFASTLPAGGYFGSEKEARRLGLMALERAWAEDAGQLFINLDESLINCGDRFNDGANALCDFARISDPVHPSEGGQAVIGTFLAHRLGCAP